MGPTWRSELQAGTIRHLFSCVSMLPPFAGAKGLLLSSGHHKLPGVCLDY